MLILPMRLEVNLIILTMIFYMFCNRLYKKCFIMQSRSIYKFRGAPLALYEVVLLPRTVICIRYLC
jgi:hypothetical protein